VKTEEGWLVRTNLFSFPPRFSNRWLAWGVDCCKASLAFPHSTELLYLHS